MISDGERLKELLAKASSSALLCSPFIKAKVLRGLLGAIDAAVTVLVVTRWRPTEIAAGVSDLEVLDVVNARLRTELRLLDDLHAKLYMADNKGLAGSANLTAPGLGWAATNNIEILIPVTRDTEEVALLLGQLEAATPATFAMRSAIEEQSGALTIPKLDDGSEVTEDRLLREAWLPSCAAPHRLYEIAEHPDTNVVVTNTRTDGLSDLRDLKVPTGLDQKQFAGTVRASLRLMPAIRDILERAPGGLTDSDGVEAVLAVCPSLSAEQAGHQWRIVRDWIKEFFGDEFEVAAESFVVRLRRPLR